MKNNNKFLLDTDILSNHLANSETANSVLIDLMQIGICFTTVINASELLLIAKTEKEKKIIRDVLNALKVLGLNSRYALSVSNYSGKVNTLRDALLAVVAEINKLPIVTFDNNRYINTSLKIIHPQELRG
ncbi:MAG: PIN domain-containing protein [Ignavibacteria bacterium]|nr:PIN domain-containing protein [Ignavibacteria bacterium]